MLIDHTNSNLLAQFDQERERLVSALGELVEDGIVDNIQHIGATSVPGLSDSTEIDIALMVWPFPLEAKPAAELERLGYEPVPDYKGAPEQRFRHTVGGFQLFFVEAGSERWIDFLTLRDYLRQDKTARQSYAARRQAWAANPNAKADSIQLVKDQLFRAMLGQAHQFWIEQVRFTPVEAVADELHDLNCPWYISGGWALDLFLGRVTRVHQDVDVVMARSDQLALQAYMLGRGWKWLTPFEKRLQLLSPRPL